jgi:hypothetical protein
VSYSSVLGQQIQREMKTFSERNRSVHHTHEFSNTFAVTAEPKQRLCKFSSNGITAVLFLMSSCGKLDGTLQQFQNEASAQLKFIGVFTRERLSHLNASLQILDSSALNLQSQFLSFCDKTREMQLITMEEFQVHNETITAQFSADLSKTQSNDFSRIEDMMQVRDSRVVSFLVLILFS